MEQAASYHTYHEITTQPQAWEDVLQEINAQTPQLLASWDQDKPRSVLFTGCGSTYYLARAAAVIFQAQTEIPSVAHPASDLVLFPDIFIKDGNKPLLVAISRSGETTETLLAVDRFLSLGLGQVIGITCYEDSSLAKMVSTALVARQAHEESIAQTRSFTSMLVAAQALATILAGKSLSDEYLRLPRLGANLLDDHSALAKSLGEDAGIERFFFLGSGPFYGLACETMLKMKEMSLSYSEAFHFMEFRHGPMSMVDHHSLVVGMLSEMGFSHEVTVLREMRTLGARVLALYPHALPPEHADYQCLLPGGLSDLERGPLYLPVLQMLAFYRSLHNGQNPDKPNNLSAVVHLNIGS